MYRIYNPTAFWQEFEDLEEWSNDDEYLSWVEEIEPGALNEYKFPEGARLSLVVIEA